MKKGKLHIGMNELHCINFGSYCCAMTSAHSTTLLISNIISHYSYTGNQSTYARRAPPNQLDN